MEPNSLIAELETQLEVRTRELAETRKALAEALEQQTATSQILRVISTSPTDVQPVFETIVRNAVSLCGSLFANVFRFDGEQLHFVAGHNVGPSYVELLRAKYPMRPDFSQVSGRVLLTRSVVRLEDVLADPDYDQRFPQAMGWRKMLGVPMLRQGDPLGVIVVGWAEPGPVSKAQEGLLKQFADHAVIAIENVRLFDAEQRRTRELTESLQQQTATADVLKVISRSTFDLQAVFDTLVESAARLCEADIANIWRPSEPVYRLAASYQATPENREYLENLSIEPGRGSCVGRTLLEGKIVHIHDIVEDREYALSHATGYRTMLGVPLLREGIPIGVIALVRTKVRPFTEKQIELVTTFADQAVIAIENVRLFDEVQTRTRELSEALEHQTATSEVLNVITRSPTDAQPVFDAIVQSAARLCEAMFSIVFLYDGDLLQLAATHNFTPEVLNKLLQTYPKRPDRSILAGRAVLDGRIAHVPDLLADREYSHLLALAGSWRAGLAVPMLRDGKPVGAISVARAEAVPFSERQIQLLTTFADQAVIAIENVRLFDEVQARTRDLSESLQQQTATSEVLKVISRSTFDLKSVLQTLVESAGRLCDADFAMITRQKDGVLFFAEAYGYSSEFIEYLRALPVERGRGTATGRALLEGRVIHIADVLADPDYTWAEAQRLGGYRTVLGVPMLREGIPVGVLTLTRSEVRPFTEKQIDLVNTFADQAAIAIENVRLFDEIQDKSHAAQRHHRLDRDDGHQRGAARHGKGAGAAAPRECRWDPPP
jgi:two-component system NtrC family sensor kinase